MATIANLNAILTLNSSRFNSGIKGAVKSLGLLTLATAAVHATIRSLNFVGGLSEMSDQLGINTKMLTGLHFAAGQVGLSAEDLNDSIGKLLKNLGKAAVDGGETAEMVGLLGLNLTDLINQDPGEAFLSIVDALAKIPNAAVRARYATELFGRESVRMNRFVAMGREGIQGMVKDADDLGITLDRSVVDQADKASDAINRMWEAMKATARNIVTEFAPAIEAVAKGLGDIVKGAVPRRGDAGKTAMDIDVDFPAEIPFEQTWKDHIRELNEFQRFFHDAALGPPAYLAGLPALDEVQKAAVRATDFALPSKDKAKLGGGSRRVEPGDFMFPAGGMGGGANTIEGKQLKTLERIDRTLKTIEKKPVGGLAP